MSKRPPEGGGPNPPPKVSTPYINTIPPEEEPPYPGDREIERRIKSLIRWNAMAMVVNANRDHAGLGGHISTYASCATLYEVGFNHFFHGGDGDRPADLVYFQGHASPGNYARAFLEGRLDEHHLQHFRQELAEGRRAVVVSASVFDAGFLAVPDRLDGPRPDHVDLPGALQSLPAGARASSRARSRRSGASSATARATSRKRSARSRSPSRENLDNLIWVVNCNLQRLDGPVRGNGKIIQELEGAFRGAGWNVIKVIWGSDWDPLLAPTRPACSSSAWKKRWMAITKNIPSSRAATRANISSASIPSCWSW